MLLLHELLQFAHKFRMCKLLKRPVYISLQRIMCAGVWLLGLPPNILSTYLISEYYTLPSTILVLLDSMSAVMSVFSVHR